MASESHSNSPQIIAEMNNTSQTTVPSVTAFMLRLPDHQKELHRFICQLFDEQLHTDVTIALDDGQYIKAHKLILSAFSSYFRQVLTRMSNPYQYPVIVVKDMVYDDLRSLIEFMYRGCTTVSNDRLPQVLKCAKQLKIKGLYECTSDENSEENHCDCSTTGNRNESKICPTVPTISPPFNCCNREVEEKETILLDRNIVNSNANQELVNNWLNKKLVPNPPKFVTPPPLTPMQQKIALDLSKPINRNTNQQQMNTLLPMSAHGFQTHPSLFRSTSIDECQLNKNKILPMTNGKQKRAPSSLDGHLDTNNNSLGPERKEKKRNLNIFHAAKYRNRKKQQLETLFNEENDLEKRNVLAKIQIEKLESSILSLIWQQTGKSFNAQTVFNCPVCGNTQTEVPKLRSHINMLHNDTEALMKFLMLQRSPTFANTTTTSTIASMSTTGAVPYHVNTN